MTRAEDLVRSTTRAIASTVGDVPALRLEAAPEELPSPASRRARRTARWRLGFAPVAAAVAVVLLAVGLVFVKHAQNATTVSPATPGTPSAAPTHAVVPYGVPEYYAWTRAGRVLVGNSVTGATVASLESPGGVSLNAVYGTTDDDRTFVVTGDRASGAGAGTQWYLLRINPGGAPLTRITRLPIPVRQAPAGVAVSPDGTMLAVALSGRPAALRVYSTATGALLHSWSAPAGQFAAASGQPGPAADAAMALRWFPGGQALAFAWNGTAIRRIDVTAPDGDLLATGDTIAAIGTAVVGSADENTPAGTAVTCDAAHGWDVFVGAQGYTVDCAATWQAATPPGRRSAAVCRDGNPVSFGIDTQQPHAENVPNGRLTLQIGAQSLATECTGQVHPGDGVSIAWTSADGAVTGSLVQDGHARFGVFAGGSFAPLPAPLASSNAAW